MSAITAVRVQLVTGHVHPHRHEHCRHNPGLHRGRQIWPWLKPCDRTHWHFPWRRAHG